MKKFKIDEYSKKETGFAVPENYFENLESRIFNLIETREVKVISIFQQPKYWITAIAAIFIIGLFFSRNVCFFYRKFYQKHLRKIEIEFQHFRRCCYFGGQKTKFI